MSAPGLLLFSPLPYSLTWVEYLQVRHNDQLCINLL